MAVFDMSSFTEYEGALVVGQQSDGATIVFLYRRFVETEMAEHSAEGLQQVFFRKYVRDRTRRQHCPVDENHVIAKLRHVATGRVPSPEDRSL